MMPKLTLRQTLQQYPYLKKIQLSLTLLLVIYFIFSAATLLRYKNNVTGDEPHYLVVASGMIQHGVLEQTLPYQEEFKTKNIYKHGLAPADAIPTLKNTHTVQGPHGLFNIHNIGLPLLLCLPFLWLGVVGAKLAMIALNSLIIVLVWHIVGTQTDDSKTRFWITLATCIGFPTIPASNQIYPDLLAGIIALSGIYWFMTIDKTRAFSKEIVWGLAIVLLPWLQIKFSAVCLILILALVLRAYWESRDLKIISMLSVVTILSFSLLAFYNHYAFGKISGPYSAGALEFSPTSLMVLMGLIFDQNQGFLLQNPIMFVGVFSIGSLFTHHRPLAFLWALLFLFFIVPNALHTSWYGGFSFSGRFEWSATMIFIFPTVLGLVNLAQHSKKITDRLIQISLCFQGVLWLFYLLKFSTLYNKDPYVWLDEYSIFYFPLQAWMPALYNVSWAYRYPPNFAWLIVIVSIFIFGFLQPRFKKILWQHCRAIGALLFFIVLVSGLITGKIEKNIVFLGHKLPSDHGQVMGDTRVANQGTDTAGFVTDGPYIPLRAGSYQVILKYSSTAPKEQQIGTLDIENAHLHSQIAQSPLPGTAGKVSTVATLFEATSWHAHQFQFKTYWDGVANITIYSVELRRR